MVAALATLHQDLVLILQGLGLPSFQRGTEYVPWTGAALLHQGEMVIPAGRAAAIRTNQGGAGGGGNVTVQVTVNGAQDPEAVASAVTRRVEHSARYGRLRQILTGPV